MAEQSHEMSQVYTRCTDNWQSTFESSVGFFSVVFFHIVGAKANEVKLRMATRVCSIQSVTYFRNKSDKFVFMEGWLMAHVIFIR